MPSALSVGSAALGGAKSVVDLIRSSKDEKKAREELAALKQPFYKIQDEYFQNRNISGELAGGGLPESSKSYYTTEAQRGLGSGINAVESAGGSPNDVNRLFDTYNNNINKVASEDAQMKVQNIERFMNYNKELAGQKTMKWTLDEYRPYERKLKEITQRIGAAKQNQNNAENAFVSQLSSAATSFSNSNLLGDLFKNNQPAAADGRVDATADIPDASTFAPAQSTSIDPNAVPQANSTNPAINPYGNGNAYWNGSKWVPNQSLLNLAQ